MVIIMEVTLAFMMQTNQLPEAGLSGAMKETKTGVKYLILQE